MKIYKKYLAKSLILNYLVTIFSLSMIVWLTQGLKFLNLIVETGIAISDYLYVSTLLMPPLLLLLSPISLFIAAILCYNRLYNSRELNVLMGIGISKLELLKPTLFIAAIIIIINYFLSLYIIPISNYKFREKVDFYRNNFITMIVQEGVFLHPSKDLTLYFSKKQGDEFENVFINDARDNNHILITAQNGKITKKNNKNYMLLTNGSRISFDNKNYHILYFTDTMIDLNLQKDLKTKPLVAINEMSFFELITNYKADLIRKNKITSELNYRIIWPLLNIVSVMIAITAIIAGDFTRRGRRKEIFYGSIKMTSILITIIFLNNNVSSYFANIIMQYLLLLVVTGYYLKYYLRFR
jgi:lipopolysaccharide export system permease protein